MKARTKNLVLCQRGCGALVEAGIDCREAVTCDGESDAMLFAPYMPAYDKPYDLTNTYERTALYCVIGGYVSRADDYLQLVAVLCDLGDLAPQLAEVRINETLATLARHQRALCRLESINRGNR